MSKIITAKDIAYRDGYETSQLRILGLFRKLTMRRNLDIKLINEVAGPEVLARIDFGRWCASCECGGSEYVDPDEPIYYCFSCGNYENEGRLRPVTFPSSRLEIEEAILERPVDDRRGLSKVERAFNARPKIHVQLDDGQIVPLSRSWEPHESLADIKKQNKPIKEWKKNK